VDADDATGKATAIMRVNLGERELLALGGPA